MDQDDLIRRIVRDADLADAGDAPFETAIPGLGAVRARRPAALAPVLYEPLVCLVIQGEKEAWIGDRSVSFGPGESLIVGIDLPTESRVVRASPDAPYAALALTLDIALLRDLAAEAGPTTFQAEPADAVAAGPADAAMSDAMTRLYGLADRPTAARVLAPLAVREIHFLLLAAGHGGLLRRLARPESHASRIARAVARIRRDFAEPLPVGDLAREAGMGLSAFHDHFKAVTATTPLQFQKRLRLIEARRLLQAGRCSVGGAAFAVGYESPTQFSREYARVFGGPPRRDRQPASGA